MNNIITASNLEIGYVDAVAEISFEINSGDFVCIAGPNGRGKSTLIKTITGLIPPKGGELFVSPDVNFGYLPQYSSLKDFPASVEEIVLSGRLKNKLCYRYSKEDKNAADLYMKVMDVSDLKKEMFNDLSGGQKQRVLLARALCSDCNVLVLDEPTNNLDEKSKIALHTTMNVLNGNVWEPKAIIMITHEKDLPLLQDYKLKVINL